jgi:hypothetical protein
VEELELAVRYQGSRGPTVYVDAADLVSFGSGPLLVGLVAAMGLSASDFTYVVGSEAERGAAELVARLQPARQEQRSQP